MPDESVGGEYRRRVPAAVQFALTLLVGFGAGVLSGMFGIGGAVVSTPAIRVLGASALEAIGSTLPSILPSSISGSFRYHRERLIRGRVVAHHVHLRNPGVGRGIASLGGGAGQRARR